jgi:type I restriction enzyme, S subunit
VTHTPLKRIARLTTETVDDGPRPLVALEHLESGTGKLLAQAQLVDIASPGTGVADVAVGDVLFGKLRPYLAKSWVADRPSFASTELLCLRPRVDIDSRWLGYVVASPPLIDWAVATSDGTKMPRTSWEKLGEFRLVVPAPTAQRSIADYLDRETERIDALIAARRRIVELLKQQLDVTRIDLVVERTKQERRDGPTWLGSVPLSWKVKRLKFVATMESGHTPDKKIAEYWIDCTIPWITLNDVSDLEAGWRFLDPKNAVNELGLRNSSAHVLPETAVVLSRDATVGRSAILGRPMAVSQHFVAWVCGPELMPEYLLSVLRGPMQQHFGSLTAGATIATIGMPDLNQLVVPIPPIGEQARIVQEVAAIERLVTNALAGVHTQIGLLQERRQALITAAITGQLDIPEAA